MAESSGDLSLGYMMGQSEGGSGGWGGSFGEGLWAVIILAILFGRGGFGGGFGGSNSCGCGCGCATQADVRAAVDQQTLISKIDQQTYGLADTFTALNGTLNSNFRGIDNAICSLGYNTQQGFNNLSHQLSDCCCNIRYDMATQACDTRRAITDSAREIIDNQNCNFRSIMDFMVQSKIDALQSENEALRLSASQAKQNQYLIDQLRPCPVPAYITCNPYAASWGTAFSGNNCGCGC